MKPSGDTPKIGLVLLQVPSNISPTSEFQETKVGDLPNLSKRAEGAKVAPRLMGRSGSVLDSSGCVMGIVCVECLVVDATGK